MPPILPIAHLTAAAAFAVVPMQDNPAMPALGPCALPGMTTVSSLADFPASLRAELTRFKDGFSDAGGPFNRDDVIDTPPAPQRRFLRGYGDGKRWILWYEHGGYGYHLHVVAARTDSRGEVRMDPFARFSGYTGSQMCEASKAYLAGVGTSTEL